MQNILNDMLIRIKNGQKAQLGAVVLHPHMPKLCFKVLEILYNEGFIRGYTITKIKQQNFIQVLLKYENSGAAVITNIFSVSTGGRRVYASINNLWKIKNGRGIIILSTSKGPMVDRDARFLNLGGEVLCIVE